MGTVRGLCIISSKPKSASARARAVALCRSIPAVSEGALGPSFAKQVLASKTLSRWVKPIANKYADIAGFRKVGLKYDDIIQEENSEVQRALGRLSPQETYDRAYRIRVAVNQSMLHTELPKDQWVKPSEDIRYLSPHILSVEQEVEERQAFDTSNIVKTSKH